MLGRCLLVVSLMAASVAVAPVARACKPMPDGEGGFHCSKYDRLRAPKAVAVRYRRARPLRLPSRLTGAAAMQVLVTSQWIAEGATGGATRLRLVDAANAARISPHLATMVVSAVTWQDGHYRVDLGGAAYQLERCRDARGRSTTCLVPASP